jgi:L-2,4-diaminobutyrate decarboxylase
MMSVKIYSMLKTYGEEIFAEYIDYTHDLAKRFAQMIQERPNFELALEPNNNIVCFRLSETPPYRGGAGGGAKEGLNSKIRQRLLEEGKFYIVQTMLRDTFYLRVSLMNPLTTEQDLKSLLDEIEKISNSLSVN